MERIAILKEQFCVSGNQIVGFSSPFLGIEDQAERDDRALVIDRTFTNRGETAISFLPSLSVRTENTVEEWFMPCVSYSGNRFGDGMDPKGLRYRGEPWIIPSDRMGIPGCTAVMGDRGCSVLFLPPDAVRSAASLELEIDAAVQRVFFTHVEYPKAYLEKFRYGDAILNELTLAPGESRSFRAYLIVTDTLGAFGYRPLIEYLLKKWARKPADRETPRIYGDSLSFLRRLTERKKNGDVLTNMGFRPDPARKDPHIPHSEFVYRKGGRYECGWCGQNISNAFLFLYESLRKEVSQKTPIAPFDLPFAVRGVFDTESEDFRNAVAILDTWQKYRFESGLFPVLLDHVYHGRRSFTLDLCNLGWLAYQYLSCYALLCNGGIERSDYLHSALGVIDALLPTLENERGFPQTVNEKGEILCELGMAGSMMTVAALQAYRITGEEKYLRAGKESFDFYYDEYLSRNAAAGGALDTYCIDKESAGPVLRAALMLERLTGEKAYLEKAENIACYLQTWMFYYDLPFPEGTDAYAQRFTTFGATAVSVQHHHLDCWASYYIPDLRYLSEISGNTVWQSAADALREYTLGGISDGDTFLHGLRRPAGAQNEAIFQSNWSFDGNHAKGAFNDWLVCWVCTFRLLDIIHLRACQMQHDFP
ncbi:MAG: hypothetical protein IJD59_05125 [Clostridia bacterium]|nr:hypothetical protein [Clostridia bacterium]